jgi:hypothetical protein
MTKIFLYPFGKHVVMAVICSLSGIVHFIFLISHLVSASKKGFRAS